MNNGHPSRTIFRRMKVRVTVAGSTGDLFDVLLAGLSDFVPQVSYRLSFFNDRLTLCQQLFIFFSEQVVTASCFQARFAKFFAQKY